ncbi:hypothetical protein KFK09_026478 [Dendrobium nobile]|uniref:Uncharacterized protein n=1 Tax=Dendrobium nobile TaxID=94219 RepID=A0A8T3A7Y9_DENNO|nr:hypothetical protein KFK09_026478 [Dendrobium nobile]
MLSAVIRSALGYPAFTVGTITGTPEVRPSRSSRTRERSSQCSNARTGGAHGFMFYFTPRWGFFSPFPHGTTSLSVTQEYLALQGGPC